MPDTHSKLNEFLAEVRACRVCAGIIPEPHPVFQFQPTAKILIVGQAPGRRVHETGTPWNDPSGDFLRNWMGMSREKFYDDMLIAIIPSGLCFPGTESGQGDLPPPGICYKTWHHRFLTWLDPQIILAIGKYAIQNYLKTTDPVGTVVANWRYYLHEEKIFPLPHPSPRNRKWLSDRPWFAEEVIPGLRTALTRIFHESSQPDRLS